MKTQNKFYFWGLITSVLIVGIIVSTHLAHAFASGSLPRELRLAMELNLLTPAQSSKSNLNSKTSRVNHANKLAQVMDRLGITELASQQALQKCGIFNAYLKSALTRQETLESLARATIYLRDKKYLDYANGIPTNFRDYKIPQKYQHAIAFLQNKFVVRGLTDGSFGSKKQLTTRESVYFLFRFYEVISAEFMKQQESNDIQFIDIATNHPIMEQVKSITQAGGFDIVVLQPSFDGNAYVNTGDATDILRGLMQRARKSISKSEFAEIFTSGNPTTPITRKELALIANQVLEKVYNIEIVTEGSHYRDVFSGTPEYKALMRLNSIGIQMGYANRTFAGKEKVTWFETINLLGKAIDSSSGNQEKRALKLASDAPATRDDIMRLQSIIRARQERVYKILRRLD